MLLSNILKHAKESFEFNLTHNYSCIDLGIVTIFDLQIKLETFKKRFYDIDLHLELEKFLDELKSQEIICDYAWIPAENSFYIKPTNKSYERNDIRLKLPVNNNIIA